MSAPWKGWMAVQEEAAEEGDVWWAELFRQPVCGEEDARAVIITTIDDESLPHPGDGKVWEWCGRPLEIVAGPWVTDQERTLVAAKDVSDGPYRGRHDIFGATDLRERESEPEHEKWCHKSCGCGFPPYDCTCERRSGEDRRKGERRKNTTVRDMAGGRRQEWARGAAVIEIKHRRSGCDRRSS